MKGLEMKRKFQFVFILFFGVLMLSACSAKHQGKYDDFFSDKKGWIPFKSQNQDLNKGNANEK